MLALTPAGRCFSPLHGVQNSLEKLTLDDCTDAAPKTTKFAESKNVCPKIGPEDLCVRISDCETEIYPAISGINFTDFPREAINESRIILIGYDDIRRKFI